MSVFCNPICLFMMTIILCRSDIVWEVEKKRGLWKAVPLELKMELESLYILNTKTEVPLKSKSYIDYKVCSLLL